MRLGKGGMRGREESVEIGKEYSDACNDIYNNSYNLTGLVSASMPQRQTL